MLTHLDLHIHHWTRNLSNILSEKAIHNGNGNEYTPPPAVAKAPATQVKYNSLIKYNVCIMYLSQFISRVLSFCVDGIIVDGSELCFCCVFGFAATVSHFKQNQMLLENEPIYQRRLHLYYNTNSTSNARIYRWKCNDDKENNKQVDALVSVYTISERKEKVIFFSVMKVNVSITFKMKRKWKSRTLFPSLRERN